MSTEPPSSRPIACLDVIATTLWFGLKSKKEIAMSGVALILRSDLDLDNLLPLSRDMLGYSPAKAADGVIVPLPKLAHYLACLSAFKNPDAPPTVGYAAPVWGLMTIGFLVAADERDMVGVLEATHGMEAVVAETVERGIQAAIIAGTLVQWQRAIKLTCHSRTDVSREVRHTFNLMYKQLVKEGFRDLFDGVIRSDQPDHTFLLEDKR